MTDRLANPFDGDPDPDDDRSRPAPDWAAILREEARRRRGDGVDPEDAAQEAWLVLSAVVAADRDGGRGDVIAARVVIAIRNRLVDLGRRAARRSCEPLAAGAERVLVGREGDPAESYERGRDRRMVRAAIEEARVRLSGPCHRIIVLRWIEGRTFGEIAAILGMPVVRVRDRHRRAMPVLRALVIRRLGADASGPPADPAGPGLEGVAP